MNTPIKLESLRTAVARPICKRLEMGLLLKKKGYGPVSNKIAEGRGQSRRRATRVADVGRRMSSLAR